MDQEQLDALISAGGIRVSASGESAAAAPRFRDLQPIGAGVDPFAVNPAPSGTVPERFYPDVPEAVNGISVLSATGEHRFKFHFHPEQAYGEQWIEEHSLVFAAFMRNPIIDFVRSVAGQQQHKDENVYLRTGFEDIHSIMRASLPDTYDMFQGGTSGGTFSLTGPPPPPGPDSKAIVTNPNVFSKTAMEELKDIVNVLSSYGRGEDALRAFSYLQRRSAQRDFAIVKWLTLPMNLGEIYFTNDLKSAIEDALVAVHNASRIENDNTLFAEILHARTLRNVFKRIVSKRLDIDKYAARAGAKTKHTREALETQYTELLFEFSRQYRQGFDAPTFSAPGVGFSSTVGGVTTTRIVNNI